MSLTVMVFVSLSNLRKTLILSLFSTTYLSTPTYKSTTTLIWWRLTISHLVRLGLFQSCLATSLTVEK
ncbi:Uncharacterised protein [Streptococcus pneumoniae]|nr:Uncharacterised protein [Streptococcus pneumoniae]